MRVEKTPVRRAKTSTAKKSHTSLGKLKDYIRICGGELGPNWQRDRSTRRYIPPEEFEAAAGASSKRYYQTRTEVAKAMGLRPVPIPEESKQPKKRKTVATADTGQTAARKPWDWAVERQLQARLTTEAVAVDQQTKKKQKVVNPNMSSFNKGKQIVILEQCLKNEGLTLQAGWTAERQLRKNGLESDINYHAPPEFVAGRGKSKTFRSIPEVVRAHKMAVTPKTMPQQTGELHGRAEHACAAAGMQTCSAMETRSSRMAHSSALYIPPQQPGEIIVLTDSDSGSSDKEDVMIHGKSGAGGDAAAASAAAQRPAGPPSWQAEIRAAFLRGCSKQISSPHLKRRKQKA